MSKSFSHRSNDRKIDSDYTGDILLWDIDKTYLDTHFSSFRGLLGIPFELAVDKEPVAGAVPLLRGLRHGPHTQSAITPLYFVSGSPVQMRKVIERRMTFDGVDFDGITFKDQLGLLLAGRPRGIKEQVGYKLKALLSYRAETPAHARWLLFGDDVESDAEVFGLFGDVCAGLRDAALERRLNDFGVHSADRAQILSIADSLAVTDDPVDCIFIHLSNNSDPAKFVHPKVFPTRSYVQTAILLFSQGRLRERTLGAVAQNLRQRGLSERVLEEHLQDVGERFDIGDEVLGLARR